MCVGLCVYICMQYIYIYIYGMCVPNLSGHGSQDDYLYITLGFSRYNLSIYTINVLCMPSIYTYTVPLYFENRIITTTNGATVTGNPALVYATQNSYIFR